MTKELEQAAKDIQECMLQFMPHIFGHKNLLKKFWDAFYVLTKENDLAVAYHEAQGWVSVEERLPESGENILILHKEYGVGIGYFTPLDGFFAGTFHGVSVVAGSKLITHWQPLPSPPKTDKQ